MENGARYFDSGEFYVVNCSDNSYFIYRSGSLAVVMDPLNLNGNITFQCGRLKNERGQIQCSICLENVSNNIITTLCGHSFCLDCLLKHAQTKLYRQFIDPKCPLCNRCITINNMKIDAEDINQHQLHFTLQREGFSLSHQLVLAHLFGALLRLSNSLSRIGLLMELDSDSDLEEEDSDLDE